jgi:hypothetical protein
LKGNSQILCDLLPTSQPRHQAEKYVMLLVKARVDKSSIHGFGLFAAEFIPKCTKIWRFTRGFDLDLDPSILDAQPLHFRDRLLHYGYIDPRLNRYILCCDDARFINHGDSPNIRPDSLWIRMALTSLCMILR